MLNIRHDPRILALLAALATAAIAAGCGEPDEPGPDRLYPGFCTETYTRSNPGDLDRVLETRHEWNDRDQLVRYVFLIEGVNWGEATYFYDDSGRLDYRIDLGYRVDYVYDGDQLVETVSDISRTEFVYDSSGRLSGEYFYQIDESGMETFDRAVVTRYDGSVVQKLRDDDLDPTDTSGGTHYTYRTDAHQILEREDVYTSDGVVALQRIYEHDSFGNRTSGVVNDLVEDDRNLEGEISFDYSCF
jgi:hypothetical protein